jgi:predicted phage terminase large subunit-like protein
MTSHDPRARAALQDEMLLRRVTQSLRLFVEWAWPILEPATPFQPNWHIDVICEYLEAITHGDIRRLVINIPPRYGKSLLVSVLWPCWEWALRPSTRWLFVSYTESLSSRHSLDRRRLLGSEWYQRKWGHVVRLTKDQSAKVEFHNTRRGVMLATSVGGSITGKGGNRLILDDPHSPTQAESDAQRAHAVDFFNHTLSTRLDNPAKDAVVLVMQRLHTADLTARCLELGYQHLCLPAIAPTRTPIIFPRSGVTHVREADSVLWPERESRTQLAERRDVLGSYGFAGQYQQQPVPRTGGLFSREWWQWYEVPPKFTEIIQSWDLAFKDGEHHDYVVGLVAGRIGTSVYLLDRFKARASFVDTCRAITGMMTAWPRTGMVLVEDAANGPAVMNVLRDKVHGLIPVTPEGGKFARACAVQPMIEARQVFLPRYRRADGTLQHEHAWVDDFVETCAAFPKGDHDDDVDALTQLLVRCQQRATMGDDMTSYVLDRMTRDLRKGDECPRRAEFEYRPAYLDMPKP